MEMKKIITSVLAISSVFLLNTATARDYYKAPGTGAGGPGMIEKGNDADRKKYFEEGKQKMAIHADEKAKTYQDLSSCIKSAQAPENLKDCHEKMQTTMRAQDEKRRLDHMQKMKEHEEKRRADFDSKMKEMESKKSAGNNIDSRPAVPAASK